MSKIKVALIGAGGIGGCHSNAYVKLPDIKITAVVDVRLENAQKLAQVHDAKAYRSIDEMFENEKIDMVDICTPTYLHPEAAIKAAEHKVHVLCEKPIALNLESARAMIDAAKDNGVFFMIAHVIRFWPEYVYLKKVYDERIFGDLKQVMFTRVASRPAWSWEDWILQQEKSGRAPIDLHIHDADYIMYLLGKPKAVKSLGMEQGYSISCITTQYVYDNAVVEAEGAWYEAQYPFTMTFRAVFEKAALDFRNDKLAVYPVEGNLVQVEMNEGETTATGINIISSNAYLNEIKYFVECIKNYTPPTVITPEDTYECLDMVLKEVKSAATGKIITL